MTVETRQLPITDIVADGATYAVPGEYHRSADIRVWLSTDDGDTWTLQAPGSDYNLEPSGPSYAGGTITPVAASPAGASLRIDRNTLREQEFGAPPTAKGYEHSLDRVVMAVQDIASAVARSIRVPDYEAVLNALPRPAARALRFLTFDAAGQPGVSAFTVDDIAALVAAAPGDAYSSETRRYPTLALAKAAIAAGVLATGMQGRVLAYDATNQGGGFDFTVVPGVTAESHPEEPRIRIDDDMLEFQMFGSKTGASGPDQRATMQACIDYAARRAEYRRATPGHHKEAIGRIFWRGHFAIDSQLLGRSDVWIAGLQDDLAISGLTARGDGRPNGAFHSANAIAMGSCWAYTSNQGFEESLIYLPSTRTAAFDRHSDTLTGVDAAALGLAVGDWIYGEIDERFKRNDGTGSNYSRFGFVYRITAIDQAAQTVTLHEPTFDGTATGATIYRIPRTEAESPLVCTKPNCAKVFAAINARLENIRIVQAVSDEGTVKSGLQADFQGQGLHLSMIDGKVRGVTVEGFKDACAGNPLAWCEIENCCFVAGYKAFEAAYGSFASKIVNIVCMVVDIAENAEGDYSLARYCFLICSEGGCFCTAHNVRCYYRSAYDGGVDRDDGEGGTIRIIPPVAAMYGQGNKWTGPDSIVKGNNVKAVALALLDDAHISGVEYGGTTHTGILVRDGRHRILQTKNDGTDYLRSALYCKSPTALITADVGDGSHYSHAVGLTDLNWFYNGTVVVGGISGKRPQNRLARNDNSAAVVPGAEKVLATYTFSDTEVDALSAITGLAVVQVAGANEGGTRRFFVRYNGARSQYAYILPKATGGTRTYQVQFNLSGLNRTNTNLAISIDRETDRQGTLGQLFSSPLAGTNTLEIVLENLLSTDPDAFEEAQGNISFQWSRFDLTNPGVVFAGTIPSFPEIDDDLDAA